MERIFQNYNICDFVGSKDQNLDFYILPFDEMKEPDVDDFHKHTFYEILWFEEGNSKQYIDFKEYIVQPNSLFIISPGQVHCFEQWENIKGGNIFFREDFFLIPLTNPDALKEFHFLDNPFENPKLKFNSKNFALILNWILEIKNEFNKKNPSPKLLHSYLQILLIKIQELSLQNKNLNIETKSLVIYKKFQQVLELKIYSSAKAEEYARALDYSSHHLNSILKSLTKKTTTELILERKILEAKRLLTYTDKNITEISKILFFYDSTYFTKIFKSFTNLTPISFREKISEKYRTNI